MAQSPKKSAATAPVSLDDANRLLSAIEALMHKFRVSEARQTQSARYLKYSPAAFQTLRWINASDRPTPGGLATYLDAAPATVTSLLDRLEAEALIERSPSTYDRRKIALSLTARGRRAVAAIAAEDRANCTDILKILDSAAREDLLSNLESIALGLRAQKAPSGQTSSHKTHKRSLIGRRSKPKMPAKPSKPNPMATERIKRPKHD